MKLNRNETDGNTETPFTQYCLNQCRKLLTGVQAARQELVNQFRKAFKGQEQMLRLALNEAEALAFMTDYPHLVFPALAMEKVQGAVAWRNHQQHLGRGFATHSGF